MRSAPEFVHTESAQDEGKLEKASKTLFLLMLSEDKLEANHNC
jgi:hypothetical protein